MDICSMADENDKPSNAKVLEQFGADTQLWSPSTQTFALASDVLANKVVSYSVVYRGVMHRQ